MFKKIAAIGTAFILALALTACDGQETSSVTAFTVEQMTESLQEIANNLEEQSQSADPGVEVTLLVDEDGKCKIVAKNMSETDGGTTEVELNTADSVEEMFEAYREAGFISDTGEILGFPELNTEEKDTSTSHAAITKEKDTEEAAASAADEIIASTDLGDEDKYIAGFPGEGNIRVGEPSATTDSSSSEEATEESSANADKVTEN